MKLNGNNLLGNRLKNCIFIHKHIGNPLHLERIVQVQLCTLAMRSLHMQWSLFKNNSYSTFTKQATRFSTTIVYIVNACLTHLVATWWQFPSHVCKLGILTLLPLLENEHKFVIFFVVFKFVVKYDQLMRDLLAFPSLCSSRSVKVCVLQKIGYPNIF